MVLRERDLVFLCFVCFNEKTTTACRVIVGRIPSCESFGVVFFWFVFLFGVCFVSTLEDTWLFAFHLFSNNVRIADRPQDVLMTVRASSVHGMS